MAEENKQLENQSETFSIKELTFEPHIKTTIIDMGTGTNRMVRYPRNEFFGPEDMGLQHSNKYHLLNLGTSLLARSIFPESNQLIFTGFSSSWTGFYISSMGEASLALDNVEFNLVIIMGRAQQLFDLMLNHIHGEKIQVLVESIADGWKIWYSGRRDEHARMNNVNERYGGEFEEQNRTLAIGPASLTTDFGEIVSVTARKNEFTHVDTWSERGGFVSKMLQEYNIAAGIYGGIYIDKNFRDCSVTDKWFEDFYHKKLVAKELEATTKYRFDRKFETVETFGVNFASMDGCTLTFNYQTPSWSEDERLASVNHYLKQFNEETIKGKQNWTPSVLRKYYIYNGNDFMNPRIVGRTNPEQFKIDNLGLGFFYRNWTENIMPDVKRQLYGQDIAEKFQQSIDTLAHKIKSCNNSSLWKSYKNVNLVESFLIRKYKIECDNTLDILGGVDYLRRDRRPQLLNFGMKFTKESLKT